MEEAGRPECRMAFCRSNLAFPFPLGFAIEESSGSEVCAYQFR
ncbi:hypothetical protein ACCUM_0139 [Candidatus Accumulibacter phosphatis]|uniref:Uncharacterized protein n=1 Tax=Candidatus Accumulibacter phosphatis TaxID=327160 RepID=A0A5S4EL37_9PROT|nr:hypothetical protein ACCUM_0139 [Candidatus Accumulibacter phosphatis]